MASVTAAQSSTIFSRTLDGSESNSPDSQTLPQSELDRYDIDNHDHLFTALAAGTSSINPFRDGLCKQAQIIKAVVQGVKYAFGAGSVALIIGGGVNAVTIGLSTIGGIHFHYFRKMEQTANRHVKLYCDDDRGLFEKVWESVMATITDLVSNIAPRPELVPVPVPVRRFDAHPTPSPFIFGMTPEESLGAGLILGGLAALRGGMAPIPDPIP